MEGAIHNDVIKWKHFPRNWPFVRGIHRSTVNSLHKGQWRGALIITLNCARINSRVNNRLAGDSRRYRPHYDVILMQDLALSMFVNAFEIRKFVVSFKSLGKSVGNDAKQWLENNDCGSEKSSFDQTWITHPIWHMFTGKLWYRHDALSSYHVPHWSTTGQ